MQNAEAEDAVLGCPLLLGGPAGLVIVQLVVGGGVLGGVDIIVDRVIGALQERGGGRLGEGQAHHLL